MSSLRLYAFLSEAMQKLVSPYVYSHPYNKWFKEYSYESFKTSYLDSEKVLDELCDSLTNKEVEVIESNCRVRIERHSQITSINLRKT
ncbi:hypothetical protein MKX03_029289 [Papaver bracteatum]|nr:hypothetical protein MKX03_029289 [Papaver bracteatum]